MSIRYIEKKINMLKGAISELKILIDFAIKSNMPDFCVSHISKQKERLHSEYEEMHKIYSEELRKIRNRNKGIK